MFLLKLGREYPALSSEIVFSNFEWKVAYMAIHGGAPPEEPPPLGEIIVCIARLGGYLNRRGDPPPGPKAMWVGLQQLRMLALGFQMGSNQN